MNYLYCGCLGLFFGLVFYYLAIHHVKVRSEYDNENALNMLKNKKFLVGWMFAGVIICEVIALDGAINSWQTIKIIILAMLAFNLSAVDIMLRRIPNAILLGMIVIHIVDIIMNVYFGSDPFVEVMGSVQGAVVACVLFFIPSLLRLTIGAGDVKYSTVIGFILGTIGYVQAMIVMAITIVLFYIYLKITKKGNLKTAAPMGPFLSIGAFVVLLLPVI